MFARWLHGTCIEAPPQKIESQDEPFVVSYFSDISSNSEIVSLVVTIQRSIKNTINGLTRYLMRWKRFRIIWKSDKVGESSRHGKVFVGPPYSLDNPSVFCLLEER